ncbi:MAG: [protein-PII] uridylyltransferase [Ferrimonas sp.]
MAHSQLITDFRQRQQAFNQQQLQQFKAGEAIGVLLAERACLVDAFLQALWLQHGLHRFPLALVAVGGYGRGELHPSSDIDLLILTAPALSPEQEQGLSQFITALWDAKLTIGHSVRSVPETLQQASNDVTIATNLLESRQLCGAPALYQALTDALKDPQFWPSDAFFHAKFEEQKNRHAKATPFDLEPNLKSAPGGLRDIQTVTWVALRHFHATCLAELVNHGYLTPEELEELSDCREFLWRLRFALHQVAKRAEDRLLFDYQREVAELMGFNDGHQLSAIEHLMKRFYRTARAVRELNQMLLLLFKQTLSGQVLPQAVPISPLFVQRGHYIEARDNQVFEQPQAIMRLFVALAQNPSIETVSASTLRLLRNARRRIKQPLAEESENRKLFMQLLRHSDGIKALSLMHRYGIMGAYLAPWQHITGQMQFDLFHAYTVDEHTHRLLQFIERFSDPNHKSIFPLGSVLIEQLPKKGLLVLAAIFHDIGKGRGGDHSDIGAEEARRFCHQHELNEHDGRLVAWLVQHHLIMSVTAQRRDLSDPDVIETFAQQVKDQNHLAYLYCLTVADICATNDQLWNNWKGSLLRELYHATRERLNAGMALPVDSRARIREHQAKVRKQLQQQGYPDAQINALWQRFRADYFLRFSLQQIQHHSEHLLQQEGHGSVVELILSPNRGGTELFVHTLDAQGLFTRIMAVLDGKRVQVHDAQIFTTEDGFALDSFIILELDGTPVQSPSRIASIRKSLLQALSENHMPPQSVRQLPRILRSFQVQTRVTFLPNKGRSGSLMELITLDRPGLLAQVGLIFEQCNVVVKAAKITTIGEKAEDIFQLIDLQGQPLSEAQQQQLRSHLIATLTQEAESESIRKNN